MIRLINIWTLELQSFEDDEIPPYAIASHRWLAHEATFLEYDDFVNGKHHDKQGYRKIKSYCMFMRKHKEQLAQQFSATIDWLWIDTCCIDKSVQTELGEALNLMYEWYASALLCLVYLHDVSTESSLESSAWLQRGWTLQELLAPSTVLFLDAKWDIYGHKGFEGEVDDVSGGTLDKKAFLGPSLNQRLLRATKIPIEVLTDFAQVEHISFAQVLDWMESRFTLKVEDRAYCLLGIFDLNMVVNYGERDKAMIRLLQTLESNHDRRLTNSRKYERDRLAEDMIELLEAEKALISEVISRLEHQRRRKKQPLKRQASMSYASATPVKHAANTIQRSSKPTVKIHNGSGTIPASPRPLEDDSYRESLPQRKRSRPPRKRSRSPDVRFTSYANRVPESENQNMGSGAHRGEIRRDRPISNAPLDFLISPDAGVDAVAAHSPSTVSRPSESIRVPDDTDVDMLRAQAQSMIRRHGIAYEPYRNAYQAGPDPTPTITADWGLPKPLSPPVEEPFSGTASETSAVPSRRSEASDPNIQRDDIEDMREHDGYWSTRTPEVSSPSSSQPDDGLQFDEIDSAVDHDVDYTNQVRWMSRTHASYHHDNYRRTQARSGVNTGLQWQERSPLLRQDLTTPDNLEQLDEQMSLHGPVDTKRRLRRRQKGPPSDVASPPSQANDQRLGSKPLRSSLEEKQLHSPPNHEAGRRFEDITRELERDKSAEPHKKSTASSLDRKRNVTGGRLQQEHLQEHLKEPTKDSGPLNLPSQDPRDSRGTLASMGPLQDSRMPSTQPGPILASGARQQGLPASIQYQRARRLTQPQSAVSSYESLMSNLPANQQTWTLPSMEASMSSVDGEPHHLDYLMLDDFDSPLNLRTRRARAGTMSSRSDASTPQTFHGYSDSDPDNASALSPAKSSGILHGRDRMHAINDGATAKRKADELVDDSDNDDDLSSPDGQGAAMNLGSLSAALPTVIRYKGAILGQHGKGYVREQADILLQKFGSQFDADEADERTPTRLSNTA